MSQGNLLWSQNNLKTPPSSWPRGGKDFIYSLSLKQQYPLSVSQLNMVHINICRIKILETIWKNLGFFRAYFIQCTTEGLHPASLSKHDNSFSCCFLFCDIGTHAFYLDTTAVTEGWKKISKAFIISFRSWAHQCCSQCLG